MKPICVDNGPFGAPYPVSSDMSAEALNSAGLPESVWMPLAPIRRVLINTIEYARAGEDWTKADIRNFTAAMKACLTFLWMTMQSNFAALIKGPMLRDEGWRNRVYEELGGEPAMEDWTARKDNADARLRGEISSTRQRPRSENPSDEETPETQGPQTDADGLFRLPVIRNGERGAYMPKPYVYKFIPFKPFEPSIAVMPLIEVTPEELTGGLPKTEAQAKSPLTHIGYLPLAKWRCLAEREYMYWRLDVSWTILVMQFPRIKGFADRLTANAGSKPPAHITFDPKPPKQLTTIEKLDVSYDDIKHGDVPP